MAAKAKLKQGLARGIYYSLYGLSYGIVYSGAFLTGLLPENHTIRRALGEGAEAARGDRRKISSDPRKKHSITSFPPSPGKSSAPTRAAKLPARIRKVIDARADKFEEALA